MNRAALLASIAARLSSDPTPNEVSMALRGIKPPPGTVLIVEAYGQELARIEAA